MSRIGKRILTIPAGIEASLTNNTVTLKKGNNVLTTKVSPLVKVAINENTIETNVVNDSAEANMMVGTANSNINNMIVGLDKGYTKNLEIVGVGYRFQVKGNTIGVNAGFSHPVNVPVPEGLSVKEVSQTEIEISGVDKQKVAEFAANVRKLRKPEPYKGKGIRYKNEHIRRKEGKKASK